jgi:hypothetical protein
MKRSYRRRAPDEMGLSNYDASYLFIERYFGKTEIYGMGKNKPGAKKCL